MRRAAGAGDVYTGVQEDAFDYACRHTLLIICSAWTHLRARALRRRVQDPAEAQRVLAELLANELCSASIWGSTWRRREPGCGEAQLACRSPLTGQLCALYL